MGKARPIYFPTLIELLLLGANKNHVEISTSLLAKRIGKSQQAASKHLLELERDGYIKRVKSGKGNSVKLTKNGMNIIFSLYSTLKDVLRDEPIIFEFKGQLFSGLKEGAYYVSLPGYRKQFVTKLGFDPFLGTLNLKLISDTDRSLKQELEHYNGILIDGFEDEQRSFSRAKCFKAMIGGSIKAGAIIIDRTHYDDSVLELLAPVKVRDRLKIKDGDIVTVKVFVSDDKSSA